MAILINDNYKLSAKKPFDDRYLNVTTPWTSCAEAIAGIPTYRYTGLTINIAGDEYWWKDGVGDGDLVPKTLGGTSNLSGATNGLQLLCGNTYIGLGGELTQDTTIYGAYSLNLGNVVSGLTAISAVTPTFHIQSANGNSSMNFIHDENEPRFDVSLYGQVADSNASMVLDVDINDSCFIVNGAPNIICNSNLTLCTTDNNTKIFNINSTNSNLKYNNEAWISSSCKMTCESITDRNDSGLNIKSVMNYDDRSHTFIKDNSTILSILSGGTARYGSNITLNNDCDLAHKWYVDNALGSISASNGLTRSGDDIILGGALTGNTTISGGSFYNLTLGSSTGQLGTLLINSGSFNVNTTNAYINSDRSNITMETCGVCIQSCVDVNNQSCICLDQHCGIGIMVCGTSDAMYYIDDYSSKFNLRSIPDVDYVTGLTTTSGVQTANNGLTKDGTNIRLGGDLTGNTTINGLDTHNLILDNINDLSLCSSSATTCASSEMLIRTPDFTLHNGINNVIQITSSCNILTDNTNSEGFVYAGDYSSNGASNPRWIPDNAYVTGLTSGSIGTASNGLTKIGSDIKLGGTLCEDTNICLGGSGGYDLIINNTGTTTHTLAEFNSTNINLCTSNINSPFEIGKICTTFNNTNISNGYTNCYSEISLTKSLLDITICGGANNASFTVTDATSTPRGIEYAADYSNTFIDESLITKRYADNLINESISGFTGITTNAITGATNGLTKSGQDVLLGGTLTTETTLEAGSAYGFSVSNTSLLSCVRTLYCGIQFTDNNFGRTHSIEGQPSGFRINSNQGNFAGIYYASDYSSNYSNRSLVDKEYVDNAVSNGVSGITSTAITGATNGLTKNGQVVKLGGVLNDETIISGGTNNDLCFGNLLSPISSIYSEASSSIVQNVGSGSYGNVTIDCCHVELRACDDSGSGFTSICLESASAGAGGIAISVDNTLNAMYYTDDYSSKFTARSIPDVAWVTGQTSASGLHTASNGLSKSGTDVRLGGSLTQNTTILGSGYSINFGTGLSQLSDFTANGSNCISLIGDRGEIYADICETRLASCADASNFSEICLDQQGIKVTVCGTDGHMFYADDYSSTYTNRSIVDKEYIDNKANVVNVCQIGSTYTTLRNDELIAVSGLSINQICLYATPVIGQRLTVVDICGNALADPIVVNGNGNNINDAICSTINTDYGSVTYVFNGIFWSAVAFIN